MTTVIFLHSFPSRIPSHCKSPTWTGFLLHLPRTYLPCHVPSPNPDGYILALLGTMQTRVKGMFAIDDSMERQTNAQMHVTLGVDEGKLCFKTEYPWRRGVPMSKNGVCWDDRESIKCVLSNLPQILTAFTRYMPTSTVRGFYRMHNSPVTLLPQHCSYGDFVQSVVETFLVWSLVMLR